MKILELFFKNKILNRFMTIVLVVLTIGVVFLQIRGCMMQKLGQSLPFHVQGDSEEVVDIFPQRPGTSGIKIIGPKIIPPVFKIDLTQSIQGLNWGQLIQMDQTADIKITVNIDQEGGLKTIKTSFGAHVPVGSLITKAMQSWRYTTAKSGTMHFWFNLGANQIEIDTRELLRNPSIPSIYPIQNGPLLWMDGLTRGILKVKE